MADQLLNGAPVIVFAKTLGASATVLGIIASFLPLTSLLMVPAARYMERYSYRNFSLLGQNWRIVFGLLIALIPWMVFLDNAIRLAILVFSLLVVNLMRLPVTTAWVPWITAVVPAERRGHFLSINQLFTVMGGLLLLVAATLVMHGATGAWEFSLIFGINTAAVILCQYFLRRMPEARAEEGSKSSHPVPWGAMLRYRPFANLILFNLAWVLTLGSVDVFRISFLRDQKHFGATAIFFFSAFSYVGAIIALPVTSRILDRVGSKPMLRLSALSYTIPFFIWFLIASGVLGCPGWLPPVLYTMTGIGWAVFTVSNIRVLMGILPLMGRNHFFALYSVIAGLGTGLAPIVWGMVLDALKGFEWNMGVIHWSRYSIYFFALMILNIVTMFLSGILSDSPTAYREKPASVGAN